MGVRVLGPGPRRCRRSGRGESSEERRRVGLGSGRRCRRGGMRGSG